MAQSPEEKKASHKESKKRYRLRNLERIREEEKQQSAEYYSENKEKVRSKDRQRYSENKESIKVYRKSIYDPKKHKKYSLKTLYNITPEQYDQMYEAQGGRCAICGKHQTELKKALAVDHNHSTGVVRGLLCQNCNVGIGNLQDDLYTVTRAMEYLQMVA